MITWDLITIAMFTASWMAGMAAMMHGYFMHIIINGITPCIISLTFIAYSSITIAWLNCITNTIVLNSDILK
jgi:hypothetical protein